MLGYVLFVKCICALQILPSLKCTTVVLHVNVYLHGNKYTIICIMVSFNLTSLQSCATSQMSMLYTMVLLVALIKLFTLCCTNLVGQDDLYSNYSRFCFIHCIILHVCMSLTVIFKMFMLSFGQALEGPAKWDVCFLACLTDTQFIHCVVGCYLGAIKLCMSNERLSSCRVFMYINFVNGFWKTDRF